MAFIIRHNRSGQEERAAEARVERRESRIPQQESRIEKVLVGILIVVPDQIDGWTGIDAWFYLWH